jgi:hypothetical protein
MPPNIDRLPKKPGKESEFEKPVAWLLGRQLIASLKGVVLLALFGKQLDPRDWMRPNVFSVKGATEQRIVESRERADDPASGEFWFDFIADTGDGQLPVYSVAYLCLSDLWASCKLPGRGDAIAIGEQSGGYKLARGSFLLVGGDTAYHQADYQTLERRFELPFCWAAEDKGIAENSERRPLFGIPGNHDYYDAIDGFNRQFRQPTSEEEMENQEHKKPQLSIPGFERRQSASYLAVRMPYDWWLWGIDSEVEHVDIRQQEFFKKLAQEHGVQKLVVATSEPTTAIGQQSTSNNKKTVKAFERLMLPQAFLLRDGQSQEEGSQHELRPGTCRLDLSGDTHHYARYWGADDEQTTANYASVVAGMGGAFLHPSQVDAGAIKAKAKYPDPKVSRVAVIRELLRPVNLITGGFIWLMGAVMAGLITFAAVRVPSSRAATDSLLRVLPGISEDRLDQPSGLIHIRDAWTLPGFVGRDASQKGGFPAITPSLLLWCSIAVAFVFIRYAAKWPERICDRVTSKMVASSDYWPMWVLAIAALASIAFGLWTWGRDHSAARVISDLVFITTVIGVVAAASFGAFGGAEILGTKGKLLFAVLGVWHGVVQLALPFLLVRLGGLYSIAGAAAILAVAAVLGMLCARAFPEVARGMDWPFGLAALAIWVIGTLGVVAAVLFLPGPPLLSLGSSYGGWALALPVLAATCIGAVMTCVTLGWYMAVSVSFNGHYPEAGGAARIGDFKQIVRFRITKDELTGFVIGCDRPRMNGAELELKLIDVFKIRPDVV